MNSLEIKKRAFMSVVTRRYGFIRTKSGAPPLTLTNCLSGNLINYKISGNVGTNLFDMNLITNSTAYEIHPDENYIDVIMYGAGTGISPEKFLSAFGLKAGDTITTSRTVEIVKGEESYNPGISGRISFASKVNGVSPFTLCASNKDVDTITIPENFNTDNYYTLILYGINKSGAILRIHNLQIVKGSYTAETMPEYEPYKCVGDLDSASGKYKIPVTVSGENLSNAQTTNIFISAPLKIGESIEYKADNLHDIALSDGTNIISVGTEVSPSAFEAEYYSNIKEEKKMELYKFINENKVKKYDGGFVVLGGRIYTNPKEETLRAVGFKPIVKADMPEYDESSQYITSVYIDETDSITESFEVNSYEYFDGDTAPQQ